MVPGVYPDLDGKTAVVTGGSRGIGAATARALAGNGAAVAIVGRDEQALDAVAASVRATGGRALAVRADCTVTSEVIESDLSSTFLTISAFLPAMIERGTGSIITMSSAAARQPAQSSVAYAAAKAGVIAFARHVAHEIGSQGIRINCIAPSAIENERMRKWMTAEQRHELGSSFPLGRIGQPDDVAACALFLASEASSWITGITLDIAGGKMMV